ncbi:hypothetical protein H0H92_000468 [Tricholoma furcatifolium]|nr:hypothetical protein H0H92_000468 [Tricholoma furcatifolium]
MPKDTKQTEARAGPEPYPTDLARTKRPPEASPAKSKGERRPQKKLTKPKTGEEVDHATAATLTETSILATVEKMRQADAKAGQQKQKPRRMNNTPTEPTAPGAKPSPTIYAATNAATSRADAYPATPVSAHPAPPQAASGEEANPPTFLSTLADPGEPLAKTGDCLIDYNLSPPHPDSDQTPSHTHPRRALHSPWFPRGFHVDSMWTGEGISLVPRKLDMN